MTPRLGRAFRPSLLELEPRDNPSRPLPFPVVFVGTESGAAPLVKGYNAETGAETFERSAFEDTFTGGVRVGAADFTRDGYPDLIAAAGVGGGPRVRILDGKTGDPVKGPLSDFFAYDERFRGGLSVAGGDVDGDGIPDLVTAAGQGGGPHVRAFSGATGEELASFFAYDEDFRGGVSVALADFTGDGKAEVVVGAGAGGGPRVRVLDALTGRVTGGPLGDFFAGDPDSRGGVNVGTDALTGDVDGDGRADLLVGSGAGADPVVTVYSGVTGRVLREFKPFEGGADGVRVASAFVNDDALADVVVGSAGADGFVKVFDAATWDSMAGPMGEFRPFGGGGLTIAASNDPPGAGVIYSGSFTLTGTTTVYVDLTVTQASDGAPYEWKYDLLLPDSWFEVVDTYEATDAEQTFSVFNEYAGFSHLVREQANNVEWRNPAVGGGVHWTSESGPYLLSGDTAEFTFETDPCAIVECDLYAYDEAVYAQAKGKGPQLATLGVSANTTEVVINADNDNWKPPAAGAPDPDLNRWAPGKPYIPKTRDYAAEDLWQPDNDLLEVTVTVGPSNAGLLTASQVDPDIGRIAFWADNKKDSPFSSMLLGGRGAPVTVKLYIEGVKPSDYVDDILAEVRFITVNAAGVNLVGFNKELTVTPVVTSPQAASSTMRFTNGLDGRNGLVLGDPANNVAGMRFEATVRHSGLAVAFLQNVWEVKNGPAANGTAAGAVRLAPLGNLNAATTLAGSQFPLLDVPGVRLNGDPTYPTGVTQPNPFEKKAVATDSPTLPEPVNTGSQVASYDYKKVLRMHLVVQFADKSLYSLLDWDWTVNFYATDDPATPALFADKIEPASAAPPTAVLNISNRDPGATDPTSANKIANNNVSWV